jgi:hypothetical protein
MRKFLLATALWIFAVGAAFAQAPLSPTGAAVMCDACTAQLAASTTSANVALPSANPNLGAVTLFNAGSADVYWAFGPTATTSNNVLPAGHAVTVYAGSAAAVAAITASGSTTLDVMQADGPVGFR